MGKISYSQFSMWDKCPYTWKANYVDKAETFKGNIYTLFGSAIHETIQAYLVCYYERTIKEADALPLQDILIYRMKELYKEAKKRYGDGFEVTKEEAITAKSGQTLYARSSIFLFDFSPVKAIASASKTVISATPRRIF